MKAFALVMVVVVSFLSFSGVSEAQGVTPHQVELAMAKIQPAILNHPEPLVREKLLGWLKTERVLFAANNILPEMSSSEEQGGGKKQVLLWYNTVFASQVPNVVTQEDKQAYLSLVLYHEAVHIDDHFSGRLPLGSLSPVGPVSPLGMAQDIWDREWSAVTKEWAFAKKLGKPYLVPVIYDTTKNGETARTFLDGFYLLQMSGNAAALNPLLTIGFTERHKKETAKLSR